MNKGIRCKLLIQALLLLSLLGTVRIVYATEYTSDCGKYNLIRNSKTMYSAKVVNKATKKTVANLKVSKDEEILYSASVTSRYVFYSTKNNKGDYKYTIYRYDYKTKKNVQLYKNKSKILYVKHFYNNKLYVNSDGLYCYDIKKKSFKKIDSVKCADVYNNIYLILHRNGSTIADDSTKNSPLYCYNLKTNKKTMIHGYSWPIVYPCGDWIYYTVDLTEWLGKQYMNKFAVRLARFNVKTFANEVIEDFGNGEEFKHKGPFDYECYGGIDHSSIGKITNTELYYRIGNECWKRNLLTGETVGMDRASFKQAILPNVLKW